MGKRFFRRRTVVQNHHLSYDPEVQIKVYSEEHYYITKIDRFTAPLSVGFLTSLKWFILRHEPHAVNLDRLSRLQGKWKKAKGFHSHKKRRK